MADQRSNSPDRPPRHPEQNDDPPENPKGSDQRPSPRTPPPGLMGRGIWGWVILAGLLVATLLLFNQQQFRHREMTINEFLRHAEQGHFKEDITVKDDRMLGQLKDDTKGLNDKWSPPYKVQARISPQSQELWLTELKAVGFTNIKMESGGSLLLHLLLPWFPLVVILLLVYFFVFRSIRNAGGGPGMLGNFGRSRHRVMNKEHSTVTLGDVAGIDEAKDEIGEIIEFLKDPKKFQRLGGRVPRGVLLIGTPGCGKTLLAKAIAGEAEVPFFSISGSDFVEMFVGVGASRVRDLFKQAKDSAPCIIFLDEIDAVGRRRGSGFTSGGHDEREQTLNAILVEMDGFETSDQVIVVAATNRADVLDPALTRPGRFDRQIHVPLPDLRGRLEILKVHSRSIKMSPNVEMERLARGTPMFSGADLAAIINEAAILATLQNKDSVEQDDLEESRDKVKWGRSRKSQKIEENERKVVAYHEAGHATAMFYDEDAEPLHKVTIIPRGPALGSTFMLPEKDRHIVSKKQLISQLCVCFGGRIAEEMFCGDQFNGTASDIRQATAIARAMVTEYGMSEKLGFQLYSSDDSDTNNLLGSLDRPYSDDTAHLIDTEVKSLINRTYEQTRRLIEEHRDEVTRLADALLKYETLSHDEIEKIMKGELLTKQTVGDLLKAEQEKPSPAVSNSSPDDEEDLGDAPGAMPSPA